MGKLRLSAVGVSLEVRAPEDDLPRLREQWSRCLDGVGPEPAETIETRGGADADYELTTQVTVAAITQQAGRLTMLHAAGVSDAEGRVAALVAASGTGKTTAARYLCERGWGYVSDETVAIDADGAVTPYPKPLSVIRGAGRPKHQHSPDELGLGVPRGQLRLGRVILLERDDDFGGEPGLEPVGLVDSLLALIPQTSALPSQPAPLRTLARHLQETGGAVRLRYREIADAAALIERAMDPSTATEVYAEDLPPQSDPAGPPATPLPTPADEELPEFALYLRGPYADAVADEDNVLVLVGNHPFGLAGVGDVIWRTTARATELPELEQVCEETFGAHPDSGRIVRETVRAMLQHGLLQRIG
ncbi:hypothetical protein G9U51_06065 [Calidifontibacter sp. DB0510]|uniref:PqqD family peptide modification chaperone n=1 Tax=Metallococcus carri TaxID=1656884 RepID=A0A967AYG6_9MICO|nr:hypothetical protein [Metallococcus carri]NHN55349.1 hypothetical protein [Metallococcus carri]NOP36426.1 hypothetical protein [Calidifontibacter sp. DB2511S]